VISLEILSFKPGHDGQIAYLREGHLAFSIEAEKDNWPRYSPVSPSTILRAFSRVNALPEVVALSGWTSEFSSQGVPVGAGYFGHSETALSVGEMDWFGSRTRYFTSSHERAHLMCAYGLSPFQQGQPCYALIWESELGTLYRIDEDVRVHKVGDVLTAPGLRYAMLYALADTTFRGRFRMEDAGKLMALAGYGTRGVPTKDERTAIDRLLHGSISVNAFHKDEFSDLPFYNIGLTDERFCNLARRFSDALFELFLQKANEMLPDEHLPLLIAGGCGLNCDWNTAWKMSGRFSEVFIPPCCNDTGAAIGTAIDAQRHFTGNAKVQWNVYAGDEFVEDIPAVPGYRVEPMSLGRVARLLADGAVLGWAQGRYEIGPRALGNRSLLAAPFKEQTRDLLNGLKQREGFRPIAPICLEEDFDLHFDGPCPSPFMLHFHRVKDDRLKAITHVDGSARVQTVRKDQNELAHALLLEFKKITGVGVLCNTSLNFKGAGFINRLSDLAAYADSVRIAGFVTSNHVYLSEERWP
jgi:hydroxymethyl cephem carbamoyltransferase